MKSSGEGWLPINGAPIGLVAWYAPDGPVVMPASWLAVVDGPSPELRAGCSGRVPGRQAFPVEADFSVNIPTDPREPGMDRLFARASAVAPVPIDDPGCVLPARTVNAPLLAGCAVQIECVHGRLAAGGWDAEMIGEIVLLHRGGLFLSPATHPDFCALQPLRTRFPS